MSFEEIEKKDFVTAKPSAPNYPYGLRLELKKQEIDKLGLQGTPKVGEVFKVLASAEVVVVSKDEQGELSISLQVKEMALKKDGEEENKQSTSKVLYGE